MGTRNCVLMQYTAGMPDSCLRLPSGRAFSFLVDKKNVFSIHLLHFFAHLRAEVDRPAGDALSRQNLGSHESELERVG